MTKEIGIEINQSEEWPIFTVFMSKHPQALKVSEAAYHRYRKIQKQYERLQDELDELHTKQEA